MTPYTEPDSGGSHPVPATARAARSWPVWLTILALLGACVVVMLTAGCRLHSQYNDKNGAAGPTSVTSEVSIWPCCNGCEAPKPVVTPP